MMLDPRRPLAFRETRMSGASVNRAVAAALAGVERRADRSPALAGWALHRSLDDERVMVVEASQAVWSFCEEEDAHQTDAALFALVGAGGEDATPVSDTAAGVIVVDPFQVRSPLVRPVSRFNLRNGTASNGDPGCIFTTVLRGMTVGGIATYPHNKRTSAITRGQPALSKRRAASLRRRR